MFGGPERHQAAFLPSALRRDLVRTSWRFLALLFALVAILLGVSVWGYDPLDPSLNTAISNAARSAQTHNVLGGFGAVIADLLVQGFGAGAWFLIALVLLTAVRIWQTLALPRPLRRLGWGAVSLVLAVLGLTLIFPMWPMAGGVIGFILGSFLPHIMLKLLVLPLALVGAFFAFCGTLNLHPGQLRAMGREFSRWRSAAQAQSALSSRLVSSRSASSDSTAPDAVLSDSVSSDALPPHPASPEAQAPSRRLRFGFLNFFRRGEATVERPELSQTIPTFLQQGAAAQSPRAMNAPHSDASYSGAPHLDSSDSRAAAQVEPLQGEVGGQGTTYADDPVFEVIDEDAFETPEREFIPLSQDDTVEEDIDLVIQRPSATLVETPQLARQKTKEGSASPAATPKTAAPATATYDPPALDLLYEPTPADRADAMTQAEANAIARRLEETLRDYGVKGDIVRVLPGPVVTLYELEPAPGTKTSRVVGLADDIARSMASLSARIASVPGKSVIGIELPNPKRETVFLHEMLQDPKFSTSKASLPLALGKDIGGQAIMGDLAKMPHLLVAGTTGSGKSVAVNTMILSLVYALSPEQVRFIMIDPKILELSVYDGIPHLLSPVVTDPKKAVVALKWVVQEMNQRYQSMSTLNVRNIANYNTKVKNALANGEALTRQVQVGFDPDTGEPIMEDQAFDMRPLPHIVVIVDEMAELMLMVGKDIEAAIQSIAQKARAAGIHMIMATQRPSVDVITGTIKANFPSRISFAVSSKIDSRTVLNEMGAEQLLGQGDMLYQPNGARTMRVHGPFASDDEVEAVVDHLRSVGNPDYVEAIDNEDALEAAAGPDGLDLPLFEKETSGDDLYDRAVQVVLKDKKVSTSHVQRRLQIGYNRAANLIDRMEDEGLITPADHVGRRKIIVPGDSAAED